MAPPLIHHSYLTGTIVKQNRTVPRKLLTHFDVGDFTHEPKNAQEPQNHGNDYDSIQDRLNGSRHWDV
jgi:hypothetical protein